MNTIYISGYYADSTAFNYEIKPSDIQRNISNIGDEERSVNGTMNRFHIAYKSSWRLTFTNISDSIADQLQIIFTTPKEFSFRDEQGSLYTVLCERDSFSRELSAGNVSLRNIPVYTVSLGLTEL